LRLPDFKTIGTWRWQGCQPYASAAFTLWYSFLLEAESTSGTDCDRKDYVNEEFQWRHRESNLPVCTTVPQPTAPPRAPNGTLPLHLTKTVLFVAADTQNSTSVGFPV
jgi:hypothetical protein